MSGLNPPNWFPAILFSSKLECKSPPMDAHCSPKLTSARSRSHRRSRRRQKRAETQLSEDTALGDRINLVFQGTKVVGGRGTVLVTETGMKTQLGQIAAMLQSVRN